MEKISVSAAREKHWVGKDVCLQGWVRTRRDSKGGFSFIEINDGSCFGNIQIIADSDQIGRAHV
jgi:asparaginyl-tRNA synthetase